MKLSQPTIDWIKGFVAHVEQWNRIAEAVTNSAPVNMLATLPVVGTIVADLRAVEGGIDAVASISAHADQINEVVAVLTALADLRPIEWNDPARQWQDDNFKTGND